MRRMAIPLAVAMGLLLGATPASAARQREGPDKKLKTETGSKPAHYQRVRLGSRELRVWRGFLPKGKLRRDGHKLEVRQRNSSAHDADGTLLVLEYAPGKGLVVDLTANHRPKSSIVAASADGFTFEERAVIEQRAQAALPAGERRLRATQKRLFKDLLENVPHLREITVELGGRDEDRYLDRLEKLGVGGEKLAIRETKIYRVLRNVGFGRIKEVAEEGHDGMMVTFSNTKRVIVGEDKAGIEVTKFGLNGNRVDRWRAGRLWKKEGKGPIRIEDQLSNESMWSKRGTRRMVDALTKLPEAGTIVFEFDAHNRPYARAAGAKVTMKDKRRVLRESSPFVQAVLDRGYEIKEVEDEAHGDWLATVTMQRPAAKP